MEKQLKQEEEMKAITTTVVVAAKEMKNITTAVVAKEEEEGVETITTVVVVVAAAAVNWLNLPNQLTTHIMSKFTSICDYARFGAVCNQWRSIFQQEYSYCKRSFLPRSQLPLLMISTTPPPPVKKKNKNKYGNNHSKKKISFSFHRVTDGKMYERIRFAMPQERYVRGSGYGWLITVDNDKTCCPVQLMNPFLYPNYSSTMDIKLPAVSTHPHEQCIPGYLNYIYVHKAVLSADPITNPKDFMVMAIFTGALGLSFCKPGDKAWTPIEHNWIRSLFYDLIYYQGKFYALSQEGSVVVCNVVERTVTKFADPPVSACSCTKNYLVVSAGELFQVRRNFNRRLTRTKQFNVFKLKGREASAQWVEVKHLGDSVFFVGDNNSMSISPIDFPGCKPNSIYYTDDAGEYLLYHKDYPTFRGARDVGVFNLENGKFYYNPKLANMKLWPPPVWIEPTLMQRRNIVRKSLC